MAYIIGRAGFNAKFLERICPRIPTRCHTGMLVGKAGNFQISKFKISHHAIENHGRLRSVYGIMIKMSMR